MRKDDTEEKDLLPILKVVFIVLLILCALLLSVFLLVWTARRTKSQQEEQQSNVISGEMQESNNLVEVGNMESTDHGSDAVEAPTEEEEPDATEESGTTEEPEIFTPEQTEENTDLGMVFTEVEEVVTAKDATNLRDIPSQGEESTIMHTLQNGQTATRTGISETGWSKLVYNGETCYAVSSLLTTDLTVKPQEEPEDDGIKTVFMDCNEKVCPKIEVNLRTLPSVTNPDSQVVATIRHGDIVTRTGINTDVGWSRVEYGGEILYCVSSYVYVVEE